MPQMAPLNWMLIYIYTIICFLILIILNYFFFYYNAQPKQIKTSKLSKNWKW